MAHTPSKIVTIADLQSVGTVGIPVNNFTNGQYLYDGFPGFGGAGSVYGWRAPATINTNWSDLTGYGKTLTKIGTSSLAATTDFLGNSGAIQFDGTNDYLSSSDAAFNFTGTFSFGLWVYKADWSKSLAGNPVLMSRWTNTPAQNGWIFGFSGTALQFQANASNVTLFDAKDLAPGWHHLAIVSGTTGGSIYLYVDGTKVGRTPWTTITAGGALEIGYGSLTGSSRFTGSIQEVWIDNGAQWSDANVWSIYTRASASYQNQQFAGHNAPITIAEPNLASSEVLAQYSFGANGGALTADDKSAYALTDVGGVVQSAGILGGVSGSAHFNGANYYTNATLLGTTPSAIAVSCWIKRVNGTAASGYVWQKINNESPNNLIAIYVNSNGKIAFDVNVNGSKEVISQTTLPTGQTGWYHIVANLDTVNGSRLWVNGVLEAGNSTATTLPSSGSARPFAIGLNNYGGSTSAGLFFGWISQFKVMNKVLTQADVDQLYSVKYTLPTDLLNKDYQLEAHYQKNGVAAFDKIIDMKGLVVSEDATSVYRAGFTAGSGLNSSDKIKVQGRV